MPTWERTKERRTRIAELVASDYPVPTIAARLGMHERSVYRHLVAMEGRSRSLRAYEDRMPRVLTHLEAYPGKLFTHGELLRVLGLPVTAKLRGTLERMEREGLIESVPGFRNDREFCVPRPVTRWRLAPGKELG
ncbi:helix-turn-helix domain-containing protein [Nonomuraea sp. NPDC050202]|uniref:helix-turn-helix domain-containing protein n=1 Tax=Nonomuraea sp. NPDC050202 TaxID=3155035 RepID=UPI0033F91CDA